MNELIILGMGISRTKCPFDAEVWSVNNAYKQVAMRANGGKIHRIFMAHPQVWDNRGEPRFNFVELNYLASKGVEIWNTHKVKGLNSRLINWRRLVEKFGCDYFSDVICYMLATAIDSVTFVDEGVVIIHSPLRIKIYGCDMHGEYALEKGGIEYWIGYARGLGIEVQDFSDGLLLKNPSGVPYGEKPQPKRKPEPTSLEMKQPTLDRVIP